MADKEFQTRQERRNSKKKPKKGSDKGKTSLFKRILFFLIIFIAVGVIAGAATFAYYVSTAPDLNEEALKDPISSKIYNEDGSVLIGELGTENRDYVAYEDIPQVVKDAVIATEDSRFYEHSGVDILRLGSAVVANFTDGFGSQGASTITQQLVKRSFLTPDKTLKRKAQELWLSLQIERKYSKEEIFEMYVNKIFYGAGANGIATAAETYYGKKLDELELHEVATLAGLPQSPSAYNPFEHPEKAEKRRNVVLQLMNKHGYISEAEMKEAQNVGISETLLTEEDRKADDLTAYDSFIDVVIEEIDKKTDFNVYTDGLEIYTTIDTNAQEYVYNMLNSSDVISFNDEKLQAGITLMDTGTGQIKAIGGGRNQKVKRGLNFATGIKRQPGSTIKPILDYGPAIEYLKWSTYEQIVDEEYSYSDGTPIKNYNGQYHGQMSIRTALAKSYNIPALKAMQAVGLEKSKEFGEGLGLDFGDEFYESYSIGGVDTISTRDMAAAYSAFGNEGVYTEPYAVSKIVLGDKTSVNLTPEPEVAMQDYTAFMITDMLKSVMTSGTGTTANVPGLPIAGKSGTTNFSKEDLNKYNYPSSGVPDAWFVGYTTDYTAAIWTGYQNKKDGYLNKEEQKYAQRMFKALMSNVSEGKNTKDFKKPNSVVKVGVEKGSNPASLPSEHTPSDQIVYEYFVKGTEPTSVSKTYDKLDAPSNLNVNYDSEANELTLSWSYSDSDGETSFKVSQSIDNGGESVLSTTTDKSIKISSPSVGSIYKFSVTAIVGGSESDPASVTIQIPDPAAEEEVDEEQEPEENEEQPPTENEDGEDSGNGNNEEDENQDGENGNENETDEPANGGGNGEENGPGNGGTGPGNGGGESGGGTDDGGNPGGANPGPGDGGE
ncbi:MAG: PBP1A family penicillin-binding protein [Bacillus sp. (in: firmicutes)]